MQIYALFRRNRPVVSQVGVAVQLLRSLCTSKVEVAWKKIGVTRKGNGQSLLGYIGFLPLL